MMKGMPIMATVLPGGTGTLKHCERMSAVTQIALPVRRAGRRILLWEDVFSKALAIWGEMMPTNPIGPQNAVTPPVTRQHPMMEIILILLTSAPDIELNSSEEYDVKSLGVP